MSDNAQINSMAAVADSAARRTHRPEKDVKGKSKMDFEVFFRTGALFHNALTGF
jgi:hypothetical protein